MRFIRPAPILTFSWPSSPGRLIPVRFHGCVISNINVGISICSRISRCRSTVSLMAGGALEFEFTPSRALGDWAQMCVPTTFRLGIGFVWLDVVVRFGLPATSPTSCWPARRNGLDAYAWPRSCRWP